MIKIFDSDMCSSIPIWDSLNLWMFKSFLSQRFNNINLPLLLYFWHEFIDPSLVFFFSFYVEWGGGWRKKKSVYSFEICTSLNIKYFSHLFSPIISFPVSTIVPWLRGFWESNLWGGLYSVFLTFGRPYKSAGLIYYEGRTE